MADYTAGAGNVQNILEHVGSDGKELLKKKKKSKGHRSQLERTLNG